MTSQLLCNVQSRHDETQMLQEDEQDESLYENDDEQSCKQNSTPKRQSNRWEIVASE